MMETKKSERSNCLGIIMAAVMLPALTGATAWTSQDRTFGESEKVEEAPAHEAPATQPAEIGPRQEARPQSSDAASQQLVKNYLKVTGGKDAHTRLRNIVASGEIRQGNTSKQFRLIETQDGKRQITYTWRLLGRDYEEVYAFDGLKAWSQALKPDFNEATPFTGPEATHFISHRWLLQPFVLPRSAHYVFKYQGAARVHGRPTHVSVGFGKKNERTWFYFDKEKSLLLRWGGYGPIAGKQEPMDYQAAQFRRVGSVLLPQELQLVAENQVFGRVIFESIEANQSLDGVDFMMPVTTVPRLRQRTVEPR
ncbi:MAG: hypothetical protein ACPGIC_07270 [Opitutales bacterium]